MVFYKHSKYLRKDIADKYDRYLPEYFFFDFNSKRYMNELEIVEKFMGKRRYNSVLELGVGTGRVTRIIRTHSQSYTGIDISESMIKRVRENYGDKGTFVVSGINEFLSRRSSLNEYDFICSFWVFNYAILSFFEYYDVDLKKHVAYQDIRQSEENAIRHLNSFFDKMKSGTEFVLVLFDAYSVEQSYVTSVLSKKLPFPYKDRGYTYKLLLNTMVNREDINYEAIHYNGFVKLKDQRHLINYFKTLHLHGALNTPEDIEQLLMHFNAYQSVDETYEIPAGMNMVFGVKK